MNAQFGIPGDGKRTGPDDDRPSWMVIALGVVFLIVVLVFIVF